LSGTDYERELRTLLREHDWIVFRSAGSFVCDIIALRPTEHMIVEAKATKGDRYYTTNNKEQFDLLNGYANQGFNVYYYVRWKRKNFWSRWKLPLEPYPVFKRDDEEARLDIK